MPGDYGDGDGQSTITELHRQVQSVRLLLGTCDNLIHTYSLLNLSPIFVIINHDGEFVYLDLD